MGHVFIFVFLLFSIHTNARRHNIPDPTTLSIQDKNDVILELRPGELPAHPSPALTKPIMKSLGSVGPR